MARFRSYDVVVVGGGAAGCVVASRLATQEGPSILLVEAGLDPGPEVPLEWRDGWTLPTLPDWGFVSQPDAIGATSKLRRGRLLGGTSWLTRFAVRGAPADFEAWAARGNPGWSFADVLPAFRAVETDAEYGQSPWHGDRGPMPITRYPHIAQSDVHAAALVALEAMGFPSAVDHNAPDAVGVGRMPMSSRSGRRVTAVDAYLPPDRRPRHLSILPDAPVAAVTLDAGVATSVRLVDGSEIRANRIVLAAGAYGSPTILMRSGIGPAEHLRDIGIDVLIDVPGVGSNLADHPAVSLDTGWRGVPTTGPILHSIATFRSAGRPDADAPDMMLWFADPDETDGTFWIEVVLLKPRSRGSVRLDSPDPLSQPRITLPSVRDSADDADRLADGYRRAIDLARHPAFVSDRGAEPPSSVDHDVARRLVDGAAYSIPHVVGTCAMGPDPAAGAVVDHQGRVHGVDGLFVIDASVIPDAPSGFPHLITMMLAERLSGIVAGL